MPIIIPEKVNPLQLSYPDFSLGSIINPDEFDQNNLDIEEKLNEFIPVVNTTIDNTVEVVAIVTNANTKSDTAIATANGAVTTANTAVTTANTANTNASNAVSVANTANTNANTAVTTANGAVITANNALNKATQVETDFNTIKPELEQAVLDVADKASVEYVDQQVANATIGVLPLNSITDDYLFDGVDHIKNRVAILRNEVDDITSDLSIAITDIDTLTDGQTAEAILTKLKTVDVNDAGINATTVQGYTPINKAGDTMTGALKFNKSTFMRNYKDVFHYALGQYTATGILKITMPMSWSNTMMSGKIKGFQYEANKSWELSFSGYNYDVTPEWFNTTARIDGNFPFSRVRFAHDGSKCCILLGNLSTIWYYAMLSIVDFLTSVSNIDGWETGWSASILTSEAGLTNIVEAELQKPITGFSGNTTILTSAWYTSGSGISDYPAYTLLPHSSITTSHKVDIVFPANYLLVAKEAGVEAVETYNNGFKLYAKKVPASTLLLEYQVTKG